MSSIQYQENLHILYPHLAALFDDSDSVEENGDDEEGELNDELELEPSYAAINSNSDEDEDYEYDGGVRVYENRRFAPITISEREMIPIRNQMKRQLTAPSDNDADVETDTENEHLPRGPVPEYIETRETHAELGAYVQYMESSGSGADGCRVFSRTESDDGPHFSGAPQDFGGRGNSGRSGHHFARSTQSNSNHGSERRSRHFRRSGNRQHRPTTEHESSEFEESDESVRVKPRSYASVAAMPVPGCSYNQAQDNRAKEPFPVKYNSAPFPGPSSSSSM
jgi:hypothetical protein